MQSSVVPARERAWLPYLALAFGVAMLGLSAILVRLAGAPGPVSATYRVGLAVVVLTPVFVVRARRRMFATGAIGLAALAGLLFAGDLAAWSTGVMMAGATNPTLLANTAPVWVGIGALLFFRERRGWLFWLGLGLALGGAVIVLGLDAQRSSQVGLGSLLGLLAGLFYGSYFLITQLGRRRLDAISFFWLSSAVNTVGLIALTQVLDQPLVGYSQRTYLLFAALAIGPQLLGWLAINYAQGHLPASIVSPTLLGQPVATAILAVPILNEQLVPVQILGGLMVLLGVFGVHRSQQAGELGVRPWLGGRRSDDDPHPNDASLNESMDEDQLRSDMSD